MTKNEVKKLVKTASSIMSGESYTDYDGCTACIETKVTYSEMVEAFSHCSRWAGEQYGNTILVSASTANFMIEL